MEEGRKGGREREREREEEAGMEEGRTRDRGGGRGGEKGGRNESSERVREGGTRTCALGDEHVFLKRARSLAV